jgi:hypothetical protein
MSPLNPSVNAPAASLLVLFGRVDMGTVGQVVYGGGKFLQRFTGVLDPSPRLSMEWFSKVVVPIAILEHRSGDAM